VNCTWSSIKGWINAAGYTHGSVAYAVMDSACAYASASLQKLAVTVNGNVTYTRVVRRWALRLFVRAQIAQPEQTRDDVLYADYS
jgi:acyl-coenzyme A thioesterase PaaI-like protein